MTEEERFSSGELHRLIQRVDENVTDLRREAKEDRHKLNNDLNVLVGQQVETRTRLTAAEREIKELRLDMKAVRRDAAVVSGGIGVMGFLASLWPWHR